MSEGKAGRISTIIADLRVPAVLVLRVTRLSGIAEVSLCLSGV